MGKANDANETGARGHRRRMTLVAAGAIAVVAVLSWQLRGIASSSAPPPAVQLCVKKSIVSYAPLGACPNGMTALPTLAQQSGVADLFTRVSALEANSGSGATQFTHAFVTPFDTKTTTFAVPVGVNDVVVEAWGGGGGGAGCGPGTTADGGGQGDHVRALIPVVPGSLLTIVIGGGGAGGNPSGGSTGTNGGDSSVSTSGGNTVTSGGGSGGGGCNDGNVLGAGGTSAIAGSGATGIEDEPGKGGVNASTAGSSGFAGSGGSGTAGAAGANGDAGLVILTAAAVSYP